MLVIDSDGLEHDVVRKPLRTFRHHAPGTSLECTSIGRPAPAPCPTKMGMQRPVPGAVCNPDFHEDGVVHHRQIDEIPVKLGQTRAQAGLPERKQRPLWLRKGYNSATVSRRCSSRPVTRHEEFENPWISWQFVMIRRRGRGQNRNVRRIACGGRLRDTKPAWLTGLAAPAKCCSRRGGPP